MTYSENLHDQLVTCRYDKSKIKQRLEDLQDFVKEEKRKLKHNQEPVEDLIEKDKYEKLKDKYNLVLMENIKLLENQANLKDEIENLRLMDFINTCSPVEKQRMREIKGV